jgi:glycosyltransferase involved in cell wall biosynthesis
MKKILFISHDANRAGAQILLLRFLQKLTEYPEFEIHVLLGSDGELVPAFEAVSRHRLYHWYQEKSIPAYQRWLCRPGQVLTFSQALIVQELAAQAFDLVVSNTVTNGALLEKLQVLRCPVVTYAHELEIGISMYTSPEAFARTLRHSDFFLACSQTLKDRYVAQYGIDPARIDVLPSLLPDNLGTLPTAEETRTIRRGLGLTDQTPLVGAVGTFDFRKGADLFVQLARLSMPDVHFAWLGIEEDSAALKPTLHMMREDLRRLGLTKRVHLLPRVAQPLHYMAAFDVFALTSREEPYPLVVLEAALLRKPILCFDQSGGAVEVVEADAGFVCPYLDVTAMSERLTTLLADPALRQRLGETGHRKVLERHEEGRAMAVFVDRLRHYARAVSHPLAS